LRICFIKVICLMIGLKVKFNTRPSIEQSLTGNQSKIGTDKASGCFFDTGKRVQSGFVGIEIWKMLK
jgi:hypothetical protein